MRRDARFGQFTANHGYEACYPGPPNPKQDKTRQVRVLLHLGGSVKPDTRPPWRSQCAKPS